MRVVGQYVEADYGSYFMMAKGGYAAIDVDFAHVRTYDGKSTDECDKCYVTVRSGNYHFDIKTKNDDYFSPETANKFIKDLVVKEIIDLDAYDMAISSAYDHQPDEYSVVNGCDEEHNTIPLEVVIVNN